LPPSSLKKKRRSTGRSLVFSVSKYEYTCESFACEEKDGKTVVTNRMDENFDTSLKDHLATVNKDLATARERLTYYEAQLGRQN
jgi:hypothetical protein